MLNNVLSGAVNWQKKKVEQLYKVSSPCLDGHQLKQKDLESVGELSQVCSQIVLKNVLYMVRIGRPDIERSVSKLVRSVIKMDSSVRQTIGKIDFLHSSHRLLPAILSCG